MGLTIAALLMLSVAVLGARLPSHTKTVDVTADLDYAGGATITFAKRLGDTTSPACGCPRKNPPGGWQGIVMPATSLTVHREGAGRVTQYDIFNPEPGQWHAFPDRRGIAVLRAAFGYERGRHPTRQEILYALDHDPELFEVLPTDVASVVTGSPLHVASIGPAAVAALGPPAGRPVHLDYAVPARAPSDRTLVLSSAFASSSAGDDDDPSHTVPMLDVLGPSVLVWAKVDVTTPFHETLMTTPPKPFDGHSLRRRSAPAFLTSSSSPDLPGKVDVYTVLAIAQGSFAVRIVPRPGDRDETRMFEPISPAAGRIVVTAPRVGSQADKLARAFARIDEDPTVDVTDIPFMTDATMTKRRGFGMEIPELWYGGDQAFQFPPTPPVAGVNVFGVMSDLTLDDARGHLTVDGSPRALGARTDLDLSNISGRARDRDKLLIPVRLDGRTAELHVQGRARAQLGTTPLATEPNAISRLLTADITIAISTIAAALLALAAVGLQIRALRATPAGI
ncbi:hypothetical protein VSS74_27435 [Conexibacter stalactiti]|uniref:DUF2330 domain-containing protein n=1 Tax=Conexibacter stalactiti TaxID=1940611 RepID=A0ABU4HXR8_9ACTN|nr:hypothetical protein [Conexibacter stalactiti]MDW5598120.1 hypothetical protein [Conexibacter stalactiti]MEC5038762.1 hypothetical protein [Conexibacter stalactiti]